MNLLNEQLAKLHMKHKNPLKLNILKIYKSKYLQ